MTIAFVFWLLMLLWLVLGLFHWWPNRLGGGFAFGGDLLLFILLFLLGWKVFGFPIQG